MTGVVGFVLVHVFLCVNDRGVFLAGKGGAGFPLGRSVSWGALSDGRSCRWALLGSRQIICLASKSVWMAGGQVVFLQSWCMNFEGFWGFVMGLGVM